MQTFESFADFVSWATSQAQAARMLRMSRASVNRILQGKQSVTPEVAEKCELVSHGLFRKERILWPDPDNKHAA